MATTQMEPASARRAFPGWDEPAIKAVFEISLTVPSHMTALSNMEPVLQKSKTTQQRLITLIPFSSPVHPPSTHTHTYLHPYTLILTSRSE